MSVKPPYRHLVAEIVEDGRPVFAVVVVHASRPAWWNVVARFESKDRAEDFAEIEEGLIEDFKDDGDFTARRNPAPPAELPEPPASNVRPENFRAPTPVEKARVGAALIEEAAEETGDAVTVTVEPKKRGGYRHGKRAKDKIDARSTSRAVSPEEAEKRTQAVLAAIIDLTAKGEKISYQTIGAKMNVPWGSIGPAVAELKQRGEIETFRHGQIDAVELREKGGIRLITKSTQPLAAKVEPAVVVVRPTDIRPEAQVEYRQGRPPPKPKAGTVFESADDFARRGGTIKRIEPEKVPDPSGIPAFPRYGA